MNAFGLHLRGRFFWSEFEVRGIRVHRSTKCTNREDAEQVVAKWYNDLAKEAEGVWVDRGYTVKDLWDLWWTHTAPPILSAAHRARVERDWRLHILPRFGSWPAEALSNADAEDLRRAYLDGDSLRQAHQAEQRLKNLERRARAAKKPVPKEVPPAKKRTLASSNKLLLHLHLVFSWAVAERKALRAVPFSVQVKETQEAVKDSLEQDQVRPFLALVDRSSSLHARVAIRAMLYFPLREDEALSMRWEWFSSSLSTFQHGARKAKDAPRFAVPADLRALLLALPPPKPRTGLVLPGPDGVPHDPQFTAKLIARAGRTLGLHLTPHSMRHTWATLTAQNTHDAYVVRNGLGHKTLDMSLEYVRLNTRDLAAAGERVFGELFTGEKAKSHHRVRGFKVSLKKRKVTS